MLDLVIKNGMVIDGTGTPAYPADIGITGDSIAVIGNLEGEASRTIDAAGHVVAPGFIDTDMSFGATGLFLVASPDICAAACLSFANAGRDCPS